MVEVDRVVGSRRRRATDRIGQVIGPRLRLAALVAQVGVHVAGERLTRPRPTTLRGVPPSPEALTPDWLNLTTEPRTFLHGDVHPGNWYVTGDGRMGLYDWQLSVQGGPARDLAYALSTHLTPGQRRAWERELLGRYLDRIEHAGVRSDLALDDLFLAYRRQLCYPVLAWLATIGRSPLQPKYQPDEISLANLARITRAFADLDTLGAVASADR